MQEEKEVWLPVKGYEGHYEVSSLGRVKSFKLNKELILSNKENKKGYVFLTLYFSGIRRKFGVHQLVAMSFLNHEISGLKIIVDHIDNNPSNNNVSNLQLISTRENLCKDKKGCRSKYAGVYLNIKKNKWIARIFFKKERYFLGEFNNEKDASDAYEKALHEINKTGELKSRTRVQSSKYKGVSFNKRIKKYTSAVIVNEKKYYCGRFDDELDAFKAVEEKRKELRK